MDRMTDIVYSIQHRHWDTVELLVWDLQRLNHFSTAEPMPPAENLPEPPITDAEHKM